MSEPMKLPPEFNSWEEVWREHQMRGKKIRELSAELAALRKQAEDQRKQIDALKAAISDGVVLVEGCRDNARSITSANLSHHQKAIENYAEAFLRKADAACRAAGVEVEGE